MSDTPWEMKSFVDNRRHGGEHHTYLITPQRGTYGSMFEDDARLASAAPELLEALKVCAAIIRIQNGNLHQDTNAILEMARLAISKAIGGK